MNIIDKFKQALMHPDSLSLANVLSFTLAYATEHYIQAGNAIVFAFGCFVAMWTKFNTMRQSKLTADQNRKIEMMRVEMEMKEAAMRISLMDKTNN